MRTHGLWVALAALAACGGQPVAPGGSGGSGGSAGGAGGTGGDAGQGGTGGTIAQGGSGGEGGTGGMACVCEPGLRCPDCQPEFTLSITPLDDPHGPQVDVEIQVASTGAEVFTGDVALAATFGGAPLPVAAPIGKAGVYKAHLDLSRATPSGDSVELSITASLPGLSIAPATAGTHVDNAPPRLTGPTFPNTLHRNQLLTTSVALADAHAGGDALKAQLVVKNQPAGKSWILPVSFTDTAASFTLDPSLLPLAGISGFDTLVFTATDSLGNTSTGQVDLRVTRVAWATAVGAPVRQPLAQLPDGSFVVAPDRATDNLVVLDTKGAISAHYTLGAAALPFAPAVGSRGIYAPVGASVKVVATNGTVDGCDLPAGNVLSPVALGELPGNGPEFAVASAEDGALHLLWQNGNCKTSSSAAVEAQGSFPTLASTGGSLHAFVGGQGDATVTIHAIAASGALTEAAASVPASEQIHVQFPVVALGDSLFASAFGSSVTKAFQFDDLAGSAAVNSLALPGIVQAPLMVAGGVLYASTHRGLAALPTSGNWLGALVASMGDIQTTPVAGAGGTLYVVDSSGKLHAVQLQGSPFDNASIRELWSAPVAGHVTSSAVLTCEGLLVFGSDDGNVYAVATDSHGLDPAAGWPRYQHDNQSTGNAAAPLPACP